ncbi:MAG: carbon-nitrogen hydrolase family protein [Candidatus Kapaibacterium sp.]|nr:carbon-nitrogen hydrolase family protein [Ignavibacteriota bacterium]MCB9221599.1 carbon-nitrogen hydrolase family protein [Ignavibacteria bacterium]
MIICLAQIASFKGDIQKNIEKHIIYVKEAIENRANLICFPELSITGYEPELAESLSTTVGDNRFDVFQELADSGAITICIGYPLIVENGINISMQIFQPNSSRQTYSKQYLHSDEKPYFVEGKEQIIIEIEGVRIAPAICYESLIPEHFDKANEMGCDVYLASVAKPNNNIERANKYFSQLSKNKNIPILMVNSIGYSDNFLAVGGSAAWDSTGDLINCLNSECEGLLEISI